MLKANVVIIMVVTVLSCQACTTLSGERDEVPITRDTVPKRALNAEVEQGIAEGRFKDRMPKQIEALGERVVMVSPRLHAFGAYDENGRLIYGGIATAGGDFCTDTNRPCRTGVGSFRVKSLGPEECRSSIYPLPNGGGLMPYCMFFNGSQALHGSVQLVDGNASHGCVRLTIEDAKWLRYQFIKTGTKVIVTPY